MPIKTRAAPDQSSSASNASASWSLSDATYKKNLSIEIGLMEGYLQTDLFLVRDDSGLQDLECALDDWSPDSLVCDLLRLKGLYEF